MPWPKPGTEMDVIRRDGETEQLHFLRRANLADLLDQERRQDRAEKAAVEFGAPDEVIVEEVMGVTAEVIAGDFAGIVGDPGCLEGGAHELRDGGSRSG